MKKKTDRKQMAQALAEAYRNKQFVGLTLRLKSNGRFAKANGQIRDVRQGKDGSTYFVMENFFGKARQDGRYWQSVAFDNVVGVRADNKTYR